MGFIVISLQMKQDYVQDKTQTHAGAPSRDSEEFTAKNLRNRHFIIDTLQ